MYLWVEEYQVQVEEGPLEEDLKHPLEVQDFVLLVDFAQVQQDMLEDIGIGQDRTVETIYFTS